MNKKIKYYFNGVTEAIVMSYNGIYFDMRRGKVVPVDEVMLLARCSPFKEKNQLIINEEIIPNVDLLQALLEDTRPKYELEIEKTDFGFVLSGRFPFYFFKGLSRMLLNSSLADFDTQELRDAQKSNKKRYKYSVIEKKIMICCYLVSSASCKRFEKLHCLYPDTMQKWLDECDIKDPRLDDMMDNQSCREKIISILDDLRKEISIAKKL